MENIFIQITPESADTTEAEWLIIWEMICWRQWHEKMAICMMNLILDVGRSMKRMITLNICLIPLKKILEINYTYVSLTQPMAKYILCRTTIFFPS